MPLVTWKAIRLTTGCAPTVRITVFLCAVPTSLSAQIAIVERNAGSDGARQSSHGHGVWLSVARFSGDRY